MATLEGLGQVKKFIDEAQVCEETQEDLIVNQSINLEKSVRNRMIAVTTDKHRGNHDFATFISSPAG